MSEQLRRLAVEAARYGAAVCLRHWGKPVEVATKSAAGDVVTTVDRAAEEAVRAVLARTRPDDGVLGEELAEHTGAGPVQWVVDPLDGTTNYTRRIPYFATSVAARSVADGSWLAGAVCAPALATTWSAAKDLGAQVRSGSTETRLPLAMVESSARLVGTGLSYDPGHRRRQLRELGALMAGYTDMRRFGAAAVDLCLLAQGSLDAFVEDDLAVHDWAAGALIAEEAGARVSRPEGRDTALSARWR
ncbi:MULTISPECIES: inositol monophosphatase family protein [unclassified Mycolicibacterium]|uniref:inositol monophosphatase family protein n=1 Tax=unclassified Mycolicibacterium TaxID=2636767 RepID=UPI0012DCF604|nr:MULTISPECIES: inositol monophosphatase family protein [unclassified Mycolicibacterium]MUL84510.1 inositol monophosphatase [Mycolicibacterium sp. CBMA 329]MUL88285.1 inositol monophosphatase [Mycolicibacterium sp. CBMA 331]MUL99266.1 inositol monophosphatase [Mycolicibacterium sp. CBMA 334]MUM28090.1 inositol monophosphatase [Mycolicibacterium sp. CBMA 295]MUM39932.1 inositol monophosphatase [Mycolicibacterium sp. CBMA 247]